MRLGHRPFVEFRLGSRSWRIDVTGGLFVSTRRRNEPSAGDAAEFRLSLGASWRRLVDALDIPVANQRGYRAYLESYQIYNEPGCRTGWGAIQGATVYPRKP